MPTTSNIPARWAYWLPFATIASKKLDSAHALFNPSRSPLQRLKLIHERAVEKLLRMGVSWPVIKRHDLDDPRIDEGKRDNLINVALERSISRRPLTEQAQVRARKLQIQKGEL